MFGFLILAYAAFRVLEDGPPARPFCRDVPPGLCDVYPTYGPGEELVLHFLLYSALLLAVIAFVASWSELVVFSTILYAGIGVVLPLYMILLYDLQFGFSTFLLTAPGVLCLIGAIYVCPVPVTGSDTSE